MEVINEVNELLTTSYFVDYFKMNEVNDELLSYEFESETILGNIISKFDSNNKIWHTTYWQQFFFNSSGTIPR